MSEMQMIGWWLLSGVIIISTLIIIVNVNNDKKDDARDVNNKRFLNILGLLRISESIGEESHEMLEKEGIVVPEKYRNSMGFIHEAFTSKMSMMSHDEIREIFKNEGFYVKRKEGKRANSWNELAKLEVKLHLKEKKHKEEMLEWENSNRELKKHLDDVDKYLDDEAEYLDDEAKQDKNIDRDEKTKELLAFFSDDALEKLRARMHSARGDKEVRSLFHLLYDKQAELKDSIETKMEEIKMEDYDPGERQQLLETIAKIEKAQEMLDGARYGRTETINGIDHWVYKN